MKGSHEWIGLVLLATLVAGGPVKEGDQIVVKLKEIEDGPVEGAYLLGKHLGGGGDGEVYQAYVMHRHATGQWEMTAEEFAVKVMAECDKQNAKKDYKASRILHKVQRVKGLLYVRVYGYMDPIVGNPPEEEGEPEKTVVVVMDLVEGLTLTQYIEQHGLSTYSSAVEPTREKIRFALELMVNFLPIFQHDHDNKIVHNDVYNKDNVMLKDGDQGRPTGFTLIDFGNSIIPNVAEQNPNGGSKHKTPKHDLRDLLKHVGEISGVCVVRIFDSTYGIEMIEVDSKHGAPLFEVLRNMSQRLGPDSKDDRFNYETYLERFSAILTDVEKVADTCS